MFHNYLRTVKTLFIFGDIKKEQAQDVNALF